MADNDVTLGNTFLNSEGANTAVLPDTNEFPSTLLAANKQIWDEKRQVAAAHQKQIAESAKNLDFTNADMSNADQAAVQGKIGGFRDKYSNNLNALTGQDTVANGKMLNDRGVVNYFIDKGKADKSVYDNNVKAIQDHPALYDQQSIDDLNKWYNQPLDSRGNPPVLTTKPTFNTVLDEHDFQAAVKPEPITTGSVNADGTHTTVTTQKVDPDKFVATVNTMFNNGIQNEGLGETIKRQQVLAKSGQGANPDIPTWDSNNLFGKDGKLKPTGTTKLSDANPFDVYMYNKQALAKNYVSKDVTAGKDNSAQTDKESDIQASVDATHRMFFDPQIKDSNNYNSAVGGYPLNTTYPAIEKAFTKKITDPENPLKKIDDTPQIFIKNDKNDPSQSRAILVYSDGSKKEVAPEQIIQADLGVKGKSGRDYSAYMKKINGDGTATYNPVKYQQNSNGNLPLEGTYTQGVEGEEKLPIPINYNHPAPSTTPTTAPKTYLGINGKSYNEHDFSPQELQKLIDAGKIKVQ